MPVPALLCFGVWLAYGVWLWRRSAGLRVWAATKSRPFRAVGGSALLFLGAGVLLGGLMALEPAGLAKDGKIESGGWWVALALGVAFVHAQVVAAALMASLIRENLQLEARAEASDRSKVLPKP
jgi:heme A synthase